MRFGIHITCVYIIFTLILVQNVFSQESYYSKQINENNGLSDNSVTCIFKDSKNIFWIGTNFGLNKIDGSTITAYQNEPDNKSSIQGNQIKCIAEDRQHDLFIATDKGLNAYSNKSHTFSEITIDGKRITCPGIVVNAQGDLYLGTGQGLYLYNSRTKESPEKIIGVNQSQFVNHQIIQMAYSQSGILYLCTFDGLWSYNEKTKEFKHEIKANELFTCIFVDKNGNCWIGTWGNGLIFWNPRYKLLDKFDLPHQKSIITAISKIQTSDGFFIQTNRFKITYNKTSHQQGIISEIKDKQTSALYYDQNEKILWEGTKGGLFLIKQNNIFNYHHFQESISNQNTCFLEWKNHYLIGGSGKDFLKLYDKNMHLIQDYSPFFKYKYNDCLSIKMKNENTVRCGTSQGIIDINLLTKTIEYSQLKDKNINQRQLKFITSLMKDSHGDWWIFPWRNGVWTQAKDKTTIRKKFSNFLSLYNKPRKLVIADACEDKNGNIWMADLDEGIVFYNAKKRISLSLLLLKSEH